MKMMKKRKLTQSDHQQQMKSHYSSPKKRRLILKKTHSIPQSSLEMKMGSFYIPKENPDKPLGEDAHIYDEEFNTIAIADGVGSWARKGIDAGEYARALMENALFSIQNQPKGAVDPKQVLNEAFLNTEAKGSSTACIITLNGDNSLNAANLGDSGFMVIRQGRVVYQSPSQQHSFNCPYQIGNGTRDTPNSAKEIVFPVETGDIIVAGTDGLFDNMFPAEIEDVVELCLKEENSPDLMAWTIGRVARQKSRYEYSISPFTEAAMDAGYDIYDYLGGKYDDVTVVVAFIQERNSSADSSSSSSSSS
ncbi:hypothetical protein M9H77_03993 [Catharanthus roseus]|uniref:Uncharacterized protein n=1 Tax=Catharanthus roseus TaxID=4058 RepID=A0ACC0CCZ7_CATRO|nr:hypothetical protein M9H77_03993 [Catharanthus roseus]